LCRSCQNDDADNDNQENVDNGAKEDVDNDAKAELKMFQDLHAAMVDRCWRKWGNKRNIFI